MRWHVGSLSGFVRAARLLFAGIAGVQTAPARAVSLFGDLGGLPPRAVAANISPLIVHIVHKLALAPLPCVILVFIPS
jgi:hypothetical protein